MKTLVYSLLFSALTLCAADVTGKWSGSFELKKDGETHNPPAYLVLKQEGDKVTGTGGPGADRQEATVKGKVDGNQLAFVAAKDGEGPEMNFKLQLEGDELKGEVTREGRDGTKETAQVSLKRVKD
jgi:hypothetical protein